MLGDKMMSVFSRRVIAYVLDFFVVSAFMGIISFIISLIVSPLEVGSVYAYFPYLIPVLGLLYFVILEKVKGATVGKSLLFLEVRSLNGSKINWAQAFVRNLTKIYWMPIIFDWAIGRFLNTDRFFSSITRTTVVNVLR